MTLNIYESKEKITSIPDLKTHGKIYGVLGIINIHGFSFLCCITGQTPVAKLLKSTIYSV